MKMNGTLINYYFHCKRQCWLHGNRINLEDNSELVKIGRALHKIKFENKEHTEIKIENIRVDKISEKYVTEYKKSDADIKASIWQLLLYISILKSKGIEKKGKLVFDEKNKSKKKTIIIQLTEKGEDELNKIETKIEELLKADYPPKGINDKRCKKCSYYSYCKL